MLLIFLEFCISMWSIGWATGDTAMMKMKKKNKRKKNSAASFLHKIKWLAFDSKIR